MIKLEVLKNRLNSRLRFNILVGLSVVVLIGFNVFDIITGQDDIAGLIFSYLVLTFAAIILAFNVYFIRGAIKDLKAIKNNKYERISATFQSFASRSIKNKTTNEIGYTGQVFKDLNSDKTYELDVYGVEHKENYDIIFGKYSRIGVAVKRIK